MVKLVFILLSILIAANDVLSKSVVSGNGLTYIGSFRRTVGTQAYDESNYYMSQNAGAWNSAVYDCKNLLGENATLVAIESEEEWNFLKEILQNYGFASDYWTSGLYDVPTNRWRWSANNSPLPPFAPWGTGFPSLPNVLLRVLLHYGNVFDAYWRTNAYTQLHRYICEVQAQTVATPCYEANDLAIVLDASGSIGANNFQIALRFVERLANAFTVYSPSRLSFLTFSTSSTVHIPITNTLTRGAISSSILSTVYEAGSTATDLGITHGMNELTGNSRAGVPMNMVVLTDGVSNSPSSTITAAQKAISAGVRTFSVGITPNINQQELLEIAGRDPLRVFTTLNFDDLINLLSPLTEKMCP